MQRLESTALLDLGAINPDRYAGHMSDSENARVRAFRRPERGIQSLCARLSLKYLVLMQLCGRFCDRFVELDQSTIDGFPAWLYREISFISSSQSAAPTLTWCGAPVQEIHVSLSHHDNCCAATIANHTRVGVDVDSPASKPAAFCRDYFSDTERAWIAHHAVDVDPILSFSLLWSLKECALKSADAAQGWSAIRLIRIVSFPEIDALVAAYSGTGFHYSASPFHVAMEYQGDIRGFDCELAGHRDRIVTVARHITS